MKMHSVPVISFSKGQTAPLKCSDNFRGVRDNGLRFGEERRPANTSREIKAAFLIGAVAAYGLGFYMAVIAPLLSPEKQVQPVEQPISQNQAR